MVLTSLIACLSPHISSRWPSWGFLPRSRYLYAKHDLCSFSLPARWRQNPSTAGEWCVPAVTSHKPFNPPPRGKVAKAQFKFTCFVPFSFQAGPFLTLAHSIFPCLPDTSQQGSNIPQENTAAVPWGMPLWGVHGSLRDVPHQGRATKEQNSRKTSRRSGAENHQAHSTSTSYTAWHLSEEIQAERL